MVNGNKLINMTTIQTKLLTLRNHKITNHYYYYYFYVLKKIYFYALKMAKIYYAH